MPHLLMIADCLSTIAAGSHLGNDDLLAHTHAMISSSRHSLQVQGYEDAEQIFKRSWSGDLDGTKIGGRTCYRKSGQMLHCLGQQTSRINGNHRHSG